MSLKLIEKAFVILSLFFFTGGIAPFISDAHPAYPLKQALPIFCLLISLSLIILRWKRIVRIVIKEQVTWLLVSITFASILWSDAPMKTLELVMPLLRVTIFSIYLAASYNLREQLRLLAWAFGIAAILSLFFGAALPKYGVVGMGFIANMEDLVHPGAWRGIYIHKTVMGSMMALGIMIFLANAANDRKYRWIYGIGLVLSLAALWMSTTKGALLILLIIAVLIPFYQALRWNYSLAIPFFIIVLLVAGGFATIFITNAEQILSVFGREITISGRTIYWPLMLDKIWERPWLGYGYETFWIGGWKGEPADIWRFLAPGNEPPHAHNGFLMVWFDIGLLGLTLFIFGFLIAYVRAIKWVRLIKTVEGLVPLIYLTMTLLFNLTESYLMRGDIFWILYVTVLLAINSQKSEF